MRAARPKSGRANPTLVGAFGRADPLGTSEVNDCRMILYLRSLSPLPARTGDCNGLMASRRLKQTGQLVRSKDCLMASRAIGPALIKT
jgi:hypothetical protein